MEGYKMLVTCVLTILIYKLNAIPIVISAGFLCVCRNWQADSQNLHGNAKI